MRGARSRAGKPALTLDLTHISTSFSAGGAGDGLSPADRGCGGDGSNSRIAQADSAAGRDPVLPSAAGLTGSKPAASPKAASVRGSVGSTRRNRLGSSSTESSPGAGRSPSTKAKAAAGVGAGGSNDAGKKASAKQRLQQQQQLRQQQRRAAGQPKVGPVHRSSAAMAELLSAAEELASAVGLDAAWISELHTQPVRVSQSV